MSNFDDSFYAEYSVAFQFPFEVCPNLKYIDLGRDDCEFEWERLFRPKMGEDGGLVWKRQVVSEADVRAWRM